MTTLSATVDLMTSLFSDQWKVDVISGKVNHIMLTNCSIKLLAKADNSFKTPLF
jgi:hypothetical protein